MRIISELQHIIATTDSYFARQLCKEDIARLERLYQLAASLDDATLFGKEAYMIGWTPGDLLTHELKDVLPPLFVAVHAHAHDLTNTKKEQATYESWISFDAARKKRLMRCT